MGDGLEYWAFLSYSHADKGWAKWLHRALETYTVPRHLIGRTTLGGKIPKKIQPIFRDRDELPVSTDLSATVRSALQKSRHLIVLCSPEAAQSEWVNQEILEFKAARGGENIICAIVGRAPSDTDHSAGPGAGFFPAALMTGDEAAEPLAADLRRGCDGKRLGKLKIIAGLLGTGLDELVQRDLQRRQRRLLGLTAASVTGMAVMAFLALSAIKSQQDEALQKAQAEELVEFMLGDLSSQLKPAGRLDTLASLGERALRYYAALDPADLDAEDRSRRARALQAIGEIEVLRGNIEKAASVFEDAYETTAVTLAADPGNTRWIFDHAQSVYWLGSLDYTHARLEKAEEAFAEYLKLSERLTELEPGIAKWQIELGSAHNMLGILRLSQGQQDAAVRSVSTARDIFRLIADASPDDTDTLFLLANAHAWLADVEESRGNLKVAFDNRISQTEILEDMRRRDPSNAVGDSLLLGGWRSLGRLWLGRGDLDAAEQQFSRSVDLGRALIKLNPTHTQWSEFTARSLLAYAGLQLWRDRLDEADQLIGEGDKIARRLTEQDKGVLHWQIRLTFRVDLLRALVAKRRGRSSEALGALQSLISDLSDLAIQHPDNGEIRSFLGTAHLRRGDLLAGAGRSVEATAEWQKTVETLGSRTGGMPVGDRATLALGHLRLNQIEQASALVSEIEELGFQHPIMNEFDERVGAVVNIKRTTFNGR